MHYPLITIVGGSGFVGRHTVKLLAAQGYRLRILVRDTVAAEFLKTSATVGQIAIEHVDINRAETLAGKFAGSDAVVNLVGVLHTSSRRKFEALNVNGARLVAAEAAKAGVKTLIHLSAMGIEMSGDTLYGTSKMAGEKAVQATFARATLLRPSLIVGPEDAFFQRFGRMSLVSPVLPLLAGGTRLQPTLVTDVAQAIASAIKTPETAGKTYELAGPTIYSIRELLGLMARITKRTPWLLPVPAFVAKALGFVCELLPFSPVITRDEVKLIAHDNVLNSSALTYGELGIAPTSIETMLPTYLSRFVKI